MYSNEDKARKIPPMQTQWQAPNNPAATATAQSSIFVMFDYLSAKATYFNHVPGGCNVLYFDGHVEFVRYPSDKAPVEKTLAIASQAFRCD